MGSYLKDFSDVKPKNSTEEALQQWRNACWLVKNRKRRFHFTANLSKRFEVREIQKSNQISRLFDVVVLPPLVSQRTRIVFSRVLPVAASCSRAY
ncbi:hypothetical protein SASPL_137851 [Salvia splendens]|uniref:Calcium-transporting P-type ATPase N-terminal autoinhibitory domain-containing protein n=1 Tax=Salvia splendens TaxID=180675 RepID=A0A8X8ZDK2_SALSN|nr:hypothetical protein SASPL_137851 [Salvia splendens]